MRASEYTIYKTKAAARFKIAAPDREFQLGCVMLNMSRAVGEKQYDWRTRLPSNLASTMLLTFCLGLFPRLKYLSFMNFVEKLSVSVLSRAIVVGS